MTKTGITWTKEQLFGYLQNPAKYIPKNKMAFNGFKKQEAADVVSYLETLSD
eukprot:CAMPEP_0116889488 /NCGR_PEP_ID=MMETSP0467-20121206/10_1 /TAXON_ID=283647 /ORGANISM="Mesodinium pulex, Strain SPMC105" /LENGTH=51 /DNA_ID=CAMNT_0004556265 /DNA_START=225 /DNA_END=380 /DNA_ORIENTATION=+